MAMLVDLVRTLARPDVFLALILAADPRGTYRKPRQGACMVMTLGSTCAEKRRSTFC